MIRFLLEKNTARTVLTCDVPLQAAKSRSWRAEIFWYKHDWTRGPSQLVQNVFQKSILVVNKCPRCHYPEFKRQVSDFKKVLVSGYQCRRSCGMTAFEDYIIFGVSAEREFNRGIDDLCM